MILLGATKLQSEILSRLQKGESYEQIANQFAISVFDVHCEEMEALAKLSERWHHKEADVKRIISTMIAIIICLFPVLQNTPVERVVRTRTTASRTARGRRQEFDEFLIMDV